MKQYTIEQFMDTTRLGGSSFSADEKSILFHSNKTGIFNVYTMPAVAGGAPKQLTNSTKESTYAVSYFPADARFLYRYDKGGNENEHLYLRELDGTERDLTPGDKTKAHFLDWSHDRKSFFFSTNTRDARYFDIFEMSIADLKPALIYQDETGYDFGAISNDKKFIAFGKTGGSPADSDVYLYNTASKEMKHLTPHEGDVANSPEAFDPKSKYLYFLSNEGGEFMYVARYDLKEGKREVVEKAPWDVSYTYFSRNGKYRVVATNEDARTKIKIYEEATGKLVPLPVLPEGDITGVRISPGETKMAFYHDGARSPANLFVYDFASKKVTKLTESLNPEINPADLVESRVIRYKSFDGLEIPAILYTPLGASAQKKLPALVRVHGGPGRTSADALQRFGAVPRQSWLRRPGREQPGIERLRQDVLHRGRRQARAGAVVGLHRGEEISRVARLRGRIEDRHHGRILRWLHGSGGARLQTRRVWRGGGHLRGFELGQDSPKHPGLLGGATQVAL